MKNCRGSLVCARCAESGHDSKLCEKAKRCANCKGDHAAYFRSCPNWNHEKEILTVKITQELSFLEARKLVDSRTPFIGDSYSRLLRQQSKSIRHVSTQTDTDFSPRKTSSSSNIF